MGGSKNITDTSSRLLSKLRSISEDVYAQQDVEGKIDKAVNDSMLTTGTVIKYYPYLNKALVRLDHSKKKVLCKILSLFGGDMLVLYTPVGDRSYCEKLREPCVLPRGQLSCLVAPLNSKDNEGLLLGYFNRTELVGFNPSKQGNFKILAFGSLQEYSIRFGINGLKVIANGKIDKSEINDWGDDVSSKHYTQKEVDDLLSAYDKRIKVLEGLLNVTPPSSSESNSDGDNNDSTNTTDTTDTTGDNGDDNDGVGG